MDDTQAFTGDMGMERDFPYAEEPRMEAPPPITADERRMHVRAYNYWVSLLDGRPFPSIEDLDPSNIEDFGPHSVLLDFTSGPDHAAIPFLGASLRAEGGMGDLIQAVAEVPTRSVLSRLTDHYLEIIANRAPIGFEAEYVNHRGMPTMYRGILMPFSSDGDTIDFIYGVINWKEVAEVEVSQDIQDAVSAALVETPLPPAVSAPIWADGPHSQSHEDDEPLELGVRIDPLQPAYALEESQIIVTDRVEPTALGDDAPLYDHLAAARMLADSLAQTDQRSRAALYRTLGEAYDFAVAASAEPDIYAEMLSDAGLKAQDRAPMTPVVKLIFGATYDKTRLAEYAAVLSYAQRNDLGRGALPHYLESFSGGLKALVKEERALRRPTLKVDHSIQARAALADAPVLATLAIDGVEGDYVRLIARREADGSLSVISAAEAEKAELIRAAKAIKA